MEVLQNRLDSFVKQKRGKTLKWPHPKTWLATPETLAEAGFYFDPSTDDPDNATCFMCNKQVTEWAEDDDPFDIHWTKFGRKMNAQNVLLTHFSARYPRMPPAVGIAGPSGSPGAREPVVALAFDHANLTIGSMWKLNMYLPVIQQTFADTSEEEDEEEMRLALAAVP
ncbi:hypothetical protein DFH09DRAFT_1160400 [Mycena vulgaris]|nr:hypothetical protein DFH09DRAFT_1160400 [Mycena vulgaris]